MKRKDTTNLSMAPPMKLKTAYLEITQRCNLNCQHCYLDNKNAIDLPIEKWFDIIDKLVDMGIKNVVIFGGEPTMFNNFWDLLQYSTERFDLVTVETNGTTPTRFNDFDCQVAISFEGPTSEENDEIRGYGTFDLSLKKLQSIDNPKLVRYTLYNDTDLIGIAMLAEKVGANSTGVPLKPVGKGNEMRIRMPSKRKLLKSYGEIENFDAVTKQKHIINDPFIYFREDLFDRFRETFIRRGRICEAGLNRIYVNHKGDITPCMFLPDEKVGNIINHSTQELIERLKKWNLKIKNMPKEGECSDCAYKNLCGGGCLVMCLNKEKKAIENHFCPIKGGV